MGLMKIYGALLQIPGMEAVELTWQEQIPTNWDGMGFMRWPLAACLVLGILVIIWKFFSLMAKTGGTRKILRDVDELLAAQRIDEALEVTRESDNPRCQHPLRRSRAARRRHGAGHEGHREPGPHRAEQAREGSW